MSPAGRTPVEPDEKISLRLFSLIETQQQKHGLQYNNFQQYRRYLTRRLARMYTQLKLKHGKRRYRKVDLSKDNCKTKDHLTLIAYLVERAWAMAECRKQDISADARIRFCASHHVAKRLKKAVSWSTLLCTVAHAHADEATINECNAYHAEISGRYSMYMEDYSQARDDFQLSLEKYRLIREVYSTEAWSLISLRISKIEEFLRECKLQMNENISDDNIFQQDGKATICWGSHAVHLSSHQIIALNKSIAQLESKNATLDAHSARSFNKLRDTYDKIIDIYTEIIEMCSQNIRQTNEATTEAQLEQNYFYYQRQRVKCDRMHAYIHFHEDKLAQQGKKTKVQTTEADIMFLYDNLSNLAQECSVVPGLGADACTSYHALAQFARGCKMYFKGICWWNMDQREKGLACVQFGEELIRESIAEDETVSAAKVLSKVRGHHLRMVLDMETEDLMHFEKPKTKKYCLTDGFNTRCNALAPNIPPFQPMVPKHAFYDCAYASIELPELVYDEKNDRVVEKTGDMGSGWFGGWFS